MLDRQSRVLLRPSVLAGYYLGTVGTVATS